MVSFRLLDCFTENVELGVVGGGGCNLEGYEVRWSTAAADLCQSRSVKEQEGAWVQGKILRTAPKWKALSD